MRSLNPVIRGAAPGPLVMAVDACVLSLATYGAEAWCPGSKRLIARGVVTPATTHLCNLVDKAVRLALRAAIPVWKTTPIPILHRESGISPARILLENRRLRHAARLSTLDNRHPLRSQASICPNVGTLKYKLKAKISKQPETQMTRLQRKYRQLPVTEGPEPLAGPTYPIYQKTKVEGVQNHLLWVRSVSPTDICAYSDGSSERHGRSAWGFVLQRGGGRTFEKGRGILHGGEVFDAEICGAIAALHAALGARKRGQKAFVLLDNQAAVGALSTGKSSSMLKMTSTFHNVARRAMAEVRWVPGHSKIRGNEEADLKARAALQLLLIGDTSPEHMNLAYIRRLMHYHQQPLLNEWWLTACPRYQDLDLQMRRRKPPELALPRRLLHELLATRSGHGDFAAYHRRFNYEDANLICDCGTETSPTHFIHCRKYAIQMRKLRKGARMEEFIKQLLGPKCLEKFIEFARLTGCFGNFSAQPILAERENGSEQFVVLFSFILMR
ncbi:hypothetical protein K3495_g3041 [Podosphaera aphanis]|nr:hypothetical protein K3495_g3041 [Podosphaera aphanis]